ncbi:MAG: PAS domain-containing protein [Acidobacteria bacterium]|nr:PAS domain-containing protein [Acidobacteriota bacterium]
MMIADDHARYVDVNRTACELLGRARDAIVGEHLSTIVAPGRQAEVDVQWQAFLRDGSQQGIFEVLGMDGTTRRVQFNARAHFAPGLHCSFLSAVGAASLTEKAPDTLTVCAWTKRVLFEGQWRTLEEYLLQAHGLPVSHGISPEASRQFEE